MRVEERGTGQNGLVIIGGIHGDEPCGVNSINRFLSKDHIFNKKVKFIIANEKALDLDARYIDSDLNRNFRDIDYKENDHEVKLSKKIKEEIKNSKFVLSLHSTRSTSTPFALTNSLNSRKCDLLKKLPVKKAAFASEKFTTKGDLPSYHDSCIEIECGYQKSKQAENNALRFIEQFLASTGAIDKDTFPNTKVDVFKIKDEVEKNSHTIFISQNFEKINVDEKFALSKNKTYIADESFYPILMSTNGYEDILGYKSQKHLCLY